MKADRRRKILVPAALVALAGVVRVLGIDWGLPDLYEEATPLLRAWDMWGWGPDRSLDLNPHFFNYPSLAIYLHLLASGALYLLLHVTGAVRAPLDYAVRFLVDPTPVVVFSRLVGVAFGAATVWLVYRVTRSAVGGGAAMLAALLLALNPLHWSRSQMIEVDVPLTFFVWVALTLAVGVTERPSRRTYILAGIAVGLAASTKYTGALAALPLAVAHLIAVRRSPGRQSWVDPGLAALYAAAAFLLTSPYVLLDFATFRRHMAVETQHMELGHFGGGTTSTPVLYVRSLAGAAAGWAVALLGLAGLIRAAVVRRSTWAVVIASFAVPYLIVIAGWSMHADRYLLPIIPAFAVFAAVVVLDLPAVGGLLRRGGAAGLALSAVTAVVVSASAAPGYRALVERHAENPLTALREWAEAGIPEGSFVVTEHGPGLLTVTDLWELHPLVRQELRAQTSRPVLAVQVIPLFQVAPERAEVFYDLSLYQAADFVITTAGVRNRYEAEPGRFARQCEFYADLDRTFEKVRDFGPEASRATVYRNPAHTAPFAARGEGFDLPALRPSRDTLSGSEDLFFYGLAVNYQSFGYLEKAIRAYGRAMEYPLYERTMYQRIVAGITWCLLQRNPGAAAEFLRTSAEDAPNAAARARLLEMRAGILRGAGAVPAPGADRL